MKIYVNYASITVCTGKQTAKTITFFAETVSSDGAEGGSDLLALFSSPVYK